MDGKEHISVNLQLPASALDGLTRFIEQLRRLAETVGLHGSESAGTGDAGVNTEFDQERFQALAGDRDIPAAEWTEAPSTEQARVTGAELPDADSAPAEWTEAPSTEQVRATGTELPDADSAAAVWTEAPSTEQARVTGTELPDADSAAAEWTEAPSTEQAEVTGTELPDADSAAAEVTGIPDAGSAVPPEVWNALEAGRTAGGAGSALADALAAVSVEMRELDLVETGNSVERAVSEAARAASEVDRRVDTPNIAGFDAVPGADAPRSAGWTVDAQTADTQMRWVPNAEPTEADRAAPLSAEEISRAFQRDGRRYDCGFPLY